VVAQNPDKLLAMYHVVEAAKDGIQKFENGEVNVREVIRVIADAMARLQAA